MDTAKFEQVVAQYQDKQKRDARSRLRGQRLVLSNVEGSAREVREYAKQRGYKDVVVG